MIDTLAVDDDAHDCPTVISIDPGGTTGWNVMMVHPDCLVDPGVPILSNIMHYEQGQFEGTELDQVDQLIDLMEAWDEAAIVCEDFQLRTSVAELSPVTIRMGLQVYMRREAEVKRPMFLQMPSLALGPITDTRLKEWQKGSNIKLYRPGEQHARDSLRHSIMFLRRAKEKSAIRKLAWPQIYGGE